MQILLYVIKIYSYTYVNVEGWAPPVKLKVGLAFGSNAGTGLADGVAPKINAGDAAGAVAVEFCKNSIRLHICKYKKKS